MTALGSGVSEFLPVWVAEHSSLMLPTEKGNYAYQNFRLKQPQTSWCCKTENYSLHMYLYIWMDYLVLRHTCLWVNQDMFLGIQEMLDLYFWGFYMLVVIRGPMNFYGVQAVLSSLPHLRSQELLHWLWWDIMGKAFRPKLVHLACLQKVNYPVWNLKFKCTICRLFTGCTFLMNWLLVLPGRYLDCLR